MTTNPSQIARGIIDRFHVFPEKANGEIEAITKALTQAHLEGRKEGILESAKEIETCGIEIGEFIFQYLAGMLRKLSTDKKES